MALGNRIPDKTVLKSVGQKLTRRGTGSNVTTSVRGGDVTLSGTLTYEHQRRPIVMAASSVPGVRRVIDQLRVEQKKKNWE